MIFSYFDIDDGVIYINDKKIDLPFPVAEALEYEQSIIVRVDPPAKQIFNSNIYRFALSGNCLWQIEPSPHGTQANRPYVSIYTSFEPPRYCRRLNILREYDNKKIKLRPLIFI